MNNVQSLTPMAPEWPGSIKASFPVFDQASPGGRLHYLDNAATTQKPRQVIAAMTHCYEAGYAPIHRGLYPLAERATDSYEQARAGLAVFFGAGSPDQLIFTRSATESLNMVAEGWARDRLKPGDQVWVTRMEHHANFLPWQRVCHATGATLRVIELDEEGRLDIENTPDLFSNATRLIAVTQVSNVLGVVNPVADLCRRARERGIVVVVDGAQAVGHSVIDLQSLDCDFFACSAHKMYGPAGIGLLYARPERLEEMEPLLVGGGMVDVVGPSAAETVWSPGPARFEAGSPNLPGAVGFAAAAVFMEQIGVEEIASHVAALTRSALAKLNQVTGLQLTVPQASVAAPVLSFTMRGVHPHDLAQIAGERQVAIRAGHHCAQPLLQTLGLTATARASFAIYNDESDLDALAESIEYAHAFFNVG